MGDFLMPSLGADMESATLIEWKVKPGDRVKKGDIVAVVETVKGAIDVEIFEEGTVMELVAQPGAEVPVGGLLARITGGAPAGAPAPQAEPAERPRVSPRQRRLAAEQAPPRTMREAIGAAMARSKREIPHYYLEAHVSLEAALSWLAAENEQRPVTGRVLPAALLLKAAALAVREVPELNGTYVNGAFTPSKAVHLGVAISLKSGGLIAPALHDADQLPLAELMKQLADLVDRARRGALKSSELADGTVTVTNLGDLGVESVFGVIYPPQVAIIGFGKVLERPWAEGGRVEVRRTVAASLSADHRVSDGHRGGLFLTALDRLLQEPQKL